MWLLELEASASACAVHAFAYDNFSRLLPCQRSFATSAVNKADTFIQSESPCVEGCVFRLFDVSHTLLSVARHVGSTAFLHNQGAYQMHLPLGILYPLHHLQIVGIHHSSMAAAHSSSNSICHFL